MYYFSLASDGKNTISNLQKHKNRTSYLFQKLDLRSKCWLQDFTSQTKKKKGLLKRKSK